MQLSLSVVLRKRGQEHAGNESVFHAHRGSLPSHSSPELERQLVSESWSPGLPPPQSVTQKTSCYTNLWLKMHHLYFFLFQAATTARMKSIQQMTWTSDTTTIKKWDRSAFQSQQDKNEVYYIIKCFFSCYSDDEGHKWRVPQHHQDLQHRKKLPRSEDVCHGNLWQPWRAWDRYKELCVTMTIEMTIERVDRETSLCLKLPHPFLFLINKLQIPFPFTFNRWAGISIHSRSPW